MKSGISFIQGGHQVAQKLSMTTLPLKLDRLTLLPSKSRSVKAGAGFPIRLLLFVEFCAEDKEMIDNDINNDSNKCFMIYP